MPFKKGESGNPKGKSKGTKNKATVLLEERRVEAYALVDDVLRFVKDELEHGDRNDKLEAISKLSPILPFILPKLASIESKVSTDMSISSIVFKDAKRRRD